MESIRPGTKVRLRYDVVALRREAGLMTEYRFDLLPTYTVEDFEGWWPLNDKDCGIARYRLSGGMIRPMDKNNVQFRIYEIMIPETALIVQE